MDRWLDRTATAALDGRATAGRDPMASAGLDGRATAGLDGRATVALDRTATAARLLVPALVAGMVQLGGTLGAAAHQPYARPLDTPAFALLLAGPVALLARRRFPMATLALAAAALLGYLGAGYPYGPVPVSFAFALISAVFLGYRRPSWVLAGLTYLGLVTVTWLRLGAPSWWLLSGVAAWLLVILTVGELGRARQERLARERRARADAAERVATEERLRIARDLHDVLAHHVSLINVQAGTALHLLDEQPGLAREALTAIKASSKEVLVELRTMLGVLRRVDEDLPRTPVAGLAGLDELAERVRVGGTPVRLHRSGAHRPLPAAVDTAAFRIVQEALTNVHRHAGQATATVLVDYSGADLVVQVDDDGAGPGSGGTGSTGTGPGGDWAHGGNGIPGMRERAAALGGRLWAGARPGGGFRVRAELPAPAAEPSRGGGGS
ncbi:MAG TPA: histidine kinase [Pseudonocardia sp.]|nr:histidine kinase [Pseudonocardia sp.]